MESNLKEEEDKREGGLLIFEWYEGGKNLKVETYVGNYSARITTSPNHQLTIQTSSSLYCTN